MSLSFEIEVCYPLFPIWNWDGYKQYYSDDIVDELTSLSNNLFLKVREVGIVKVEILEIDAISFYEKLDKMPRRNNSSFAGECKNVLIFRTSINFTPIESYNSYKERVMSENDWVAWVKAEIALNFAHAVYYSLILCNVAKPGAIQTVEGVIFIDKKFDTSIFAVWSFLREGIPFIEGLGWPKLKTLPYKLVFEWFNNHKLSFDRFSNTKVERCLNSFTNLFAEGSHEPGYNLFWSLRGIEAIYCTNKQGMAEQIFEKTQLLLGQMGNFNKKLKKMYDIRSRLIHGDLNFGPIHYEAIDEKEENISDELFDSEVLAIYILTATLQELVERNTSDLNFSYSIV